MKISEVLRKARPLIESGRVDFVCHAVYMAEHGCSINKLPIPFYTAATPTINYINDLVYPRSTVQGWLKDNLMEPFDTFTPYMKDYRLRWIDHMIEELEKEGK